jgi:hypothetical protein
MADLDRVRRWAAALIALHLDPSWSFEFDNAKKRAGLCNFTARRITVSRYLAARYEDDEVHQILLHEVAHALAGPRRQRATDATCGATCTSFHNTTSQLWPWPARWKDARYGAGSWRRGLAAGRRR